MEWLPSATRQSWNRDGGSWTDAGEPKGCLHTTETTDWPSYSSGAAAPHLTVRPIPNVGVEVRQHTPFTVAARALRNPSGGVQTNRDRVYQIELVGTCDPAYASRYGGYLWAEADDAVLRDLFGKVVKPLSDAFGIPLRAPAFLAYPQSYGASRVRMSGPTFDAYSGWLGHQHVPENTHGDPGDFPWARMVALGGGAPAIISAAPIRPTTDGGVNVAALPLLRRGAKGADVRRVQGLLLANGVGVGRAGLDGDFGPATDSAVHTFQSRAGIGVDGIVGPITWSRLLGV